MTKLLAFFTEELSFETIELLLENEDLFAQFLDGFLIFSQVDELTQSGCQSNKIVMI